MAGEGTLYLAKSTEYIHTYWSRSGGDYGRESPTTACYVIYVLEMVHIYMEFVPGDQSQIY